MTQEPLSPQQIKDFQDRIHTWGSELYRDLPWRNTRDPYEVLASEIMLQQTQVARVLTKWPQWLQAFPTIADLAAVPLAPVLEHWQGLGYNRRAIAFKKCAETCTQEFGSALPQDDKQLQSLPGIGPATAAGVRAFAFGLPGVYLETNVRTVFLHELFPDCDGVSDKELIPLIEATCDQQDPRKWYYALLDYGVYLKAQNPNPSRRSKHHTTQSRFEGSRRQKRAWLLREILNAPSTLTTQQLAEDLSKTESEAGRSEVEYEAAASILGDLSKDGFIVCEANDMWSVS